MDVAMMAHLRVGQAFDLLTQLLLKYLIVRHDSKSCAHAGKQWIHAWDCEGSTVSTWDALAIRLDVIVQLRLQ